MEKVDITTKLNLIKIKKGVPKPERPFLLLNKSD
jgi:hypothetical protein